MSARLDQVLLSKATESVLSIVLKDFRRGLVDLDKVKEMAERRRDAINAMYRDLVREKNRGPARCADCAQPATVTMNGKRVCKAHAPKYRLEAP